MSQHVLSVESSSLLDYRSYLWLIVVRNESWNSHKTSTRTEQIYVFTTMEAESESWDPVKLAEAPK